MGRRGAEIDSLRRVSHINFEEIASASHFSKSARSSASPVIFGHCQKTNPRCASSSNWPTRPESVRESSVGPPGLESWLAVFPALKRWAKFDRPSGLGFREVGLTGLFLDCSARRTEDYGLSDRQSSDASDGAVDSRGVLVRTNDRLQH